MTTELETFLKNRTRVWAGQITKLAKALAPNHLKNYISSKTDFIRDGKFRIITTVANKKPTGPGHPNYGTSDAHAQEFGSGLHAKRGAKQKYPIFPKNKRVLAFNWEVANADPARFIFAPDGRVLLPSVQHPGIQAANSGKGYIAPAHNEVRKQIKEELQTMGAASIRAELRRGFEGRRIR